MPKASKNSDQPTPNAATKPAGKSEAVVSAAAKPSTVKASTSPAETNVEAQPDATSNTQAEEVKEPRKPRQTTDEVASKKDEDKTSVTKKASKPAVSAATDAAEDAPRGDDFLERQRQLLLTERGNYMRQAEELKAEADALALEHEPGDVQFDEEGGEGGTANVDREVDLYLSSQALAAIEEMDIALAKIDAGTYGACENCGKPIPEARLEVLPQARLCVSCKSGGLSSRR